MTLTRIEVMDLLTTRGLSPSRALGQNFVVDPNTVRRVARLSGAGPGDRIVEIGAGLGCLTLALAETGAEVTAVEVDRYLVPVLRELTEPLGVRVVRGDATALDWGHLLGTQPRSFALVANLPYNVATPLVLDLLDNVDAIGVMLVMVQREAGERLAASPGSSTYGLPSLKVSYWASAAIVGSVAPTVFLPQPRVESVLVKIVRRDSPAVEADPDRLFALARRAFGQRRKMLRRSLHGVVSAEQFGRACVDPSARPEQLGIAEWDRLCAVCGSD